MNDACRWFNCNTGFCEHATADPSRRPQCARLLFGQWVQWEHAITEGILRCPHYKRITIRDIICDALENRQEGRE